jgi:hypothetical protein
VNSISIVVVLLGFLLALAMLAALVLIWRELYLFRVNRKTILRQYSDAFLHRGD